MAFSIHPIVAFLCISSYTLWFLVKDMQHEVLLPYIYVALKLKFGPRNFNSSCRPRKGLNECGLEDVVNDYMSSNPIFNGYSFENDLTWFHLSFRINLFNLMKRSSLHIIFV